MESTKLLFILIFFIFSCGKDKDKKEVVASKKEHLEGSFSATLQPVNLKVTTDIQGKVMITRYGDDFKVNIRVAYAPKGIHAQHLYTGSACPTYADDIDFDGYISASEAQRAMGPILIPFDSDLSAQALGANYPSGTKYNYSESTSYALMLSDLQRPDEILNDNIVKLAGPDLILEGRVVAILGTPQVKDLPIACGILAYEGEVPSEEWVPLPEEPRPRRPRVIRPRPPEPVPEVEESQPPRQSWWAHLRRRVGGWGARIRDWWLRRRGQGMET